MKTLAHIIALLLVLPALLIEQGWAISTLWGWFLVPIGLPAIGTASAIGIALTVGVMRLKGKRNEPERTSRQAYEFLAGLFFYPLLTVGSGWIVKQFV